MLRAWGTVLNPTDREIEILKVLWEIGAGNVRAVHERLSPAGELHFNTVLASALWTSQVNKKLEVIVHSPCVNRLLPCEKPLYLRRFLRATFISCSNSSSVSAFTRSAASMLKTS